MPNHVYSTLRVEGSKEDIKLFKKTYEDKKSVLDSNKIIEYPEHFTLLDKNHRINSKWGESPIGTKGQLTKTDKRKLTLLALEGWDLNKDGYNQGGYDWFLQNCGTKWGMYNIELETDKSKELLYRFQTAWSPCYPMIAIMSKRFPRLTFTYFTEEESGEFSFEQEWKDGTIVWEDDLTEEYNKKINDEWEEVKRQEDKEIKK